MDEVVIEFTESAFRHNISEENIRHAVTYRERDSIIFDLPEKHAAIGCDRAANLLEIMYNQVDDNTIQVFHAMRLRDSFIIKYGL